MAADGVRSLEELKLLLKQPNDAFDGLVKKAEKSSNGDESLRDQKLTKLVVHDLIRNCGKKKESPQQLPVVPKKPKRKLADPINAVPISAWSPSLGFVKVGPTTFEPYNGTTNGNGVELGLGLPRENPDNRRSRQKRGLGQIMIDAEEKHKKKMPRISIKEAKQLRARGSKLRIPEDARTRMKNLGGNNPVLVITKYLYGTDLSTHHGRLSLPVKQLAGGVKTDSKFLSESEWAMIMADKNNSVKARLVGPSCSDPTEVSLKVWWMKNAPELVISGGWGHFVAKYKSEHPGAVKEGDAIQVWASRCNGGSDDVVLALVVVEPAAD